MANKYKWLAVTMGILLITLGTWYYLRQPKSSKEPKGTVEYDTLALPTHYKKVSLKPFKYVVINCDLGPIKVNFEADQKSFVEFHHTFMKYVEMNYSGDTLLLHALRTPKSTYEKPINKQIYIHTPEIRYYRGEATQTLFSNFISGSLKVDNRSSYIRFQGCEIENLNLTTNKSCNYVIDANCSFNKIDAKINPNSAFTCMGSVYSELFLTTNNLEKIRFGKNIKKLRMKKYSK